MQVTSVQYRVCLGILVLLAGSHSFAAEGGAASASDGVFQIRSPNGRYQVEFSQPRTTPAHPEDALWATITVRDLSKGTQRTAHVAEGQRGSGHSWQAFRPYDEADAWSPDGLYVAYLNCGCIDQKGVPEFDAVCHTEIAFLSMIPPRHNRRELVVCRLAFGGWDPKRVHTVIEIDMARSDGTSHRRLPYVTGHDPGR